MNALCPHDYWQRRGPLLLDAAARWSGWKDAQLHLSIYPTAQALTEPPQLSIGAVIVCNTPTETLHAVGIALAKIGSVNAERLSHQDERLPPRCKQAVGVK